MTHWLVMWSADTAKRGEGALLDYAGSNQFERQGIEAGDWLYFVTVMDGRLLLLGNFEVDQVASEEAAQRRLGPELEPWPATGHVFATPSTVRPTVIEPIQHLAEDLRFVSPAGKDRLILEDGRVNGQQLQTIRRLTEASAALLREGT